MPRIRALFVLLLMFVIGNPAVKLRAQQPAAANNPNVTVDPSFYSTMRYRQVNFTRGGRVTAVTGVSGQPLTFYMGAAGGGVWKTTDAGTTWKNITDGFLEVGTV